MSPGPANEASQTLTFQVTVDKATLFAPDQGPAIDKSGTLIYPPAASGPGGVAWVTVYLADSGGATSEPVTFSINVIGPPTGLTATAAITPLRVSVSWVNPTPAEVLLYRRVGTGAWGTPLKLPAGTSRYVDVNVVPSTTYTYKAAATKQGVGTSPFSNEDDATTAAAPEAPTNLTATQVTGALIVDVAWQDNSTDESCFLLYRKIGAGSWLVYTRVAANQRSYRDVGVAGGTTYSYKVRGYKDGVSYSLYSNEDDVALPRIPATPTGLTATRGLAPRRVDLACTDNSDDEQSFINYRKVGTGAFAYYNKVGPNVKTYRDTG